MRDGVGRAGFHAVTAKDAAVVIDVVDLGVTLRSAEALLFGVFGGFDIDAVGGTGGGAKKAGYALFKTILIALQNVRASVTLRDLRGSVGVFFRNRGLQHLPEGDAHALSDGCRRTEYFTNFGHAVFSVAQRRAE